MATVSIAVKASGDSKTGNVACTYTGHQSCPANCPMIDSCYADTGNVAFVTRRLSAESTVSALECAIQEANAIDTLPADRDLRLHVVGDCVDDACALIVDGACKRYIDRAKANGISVRVWTYTHAWRNVDRRAWRNVSILASCESTRDVIEAAIRGYSAALVVQAHPSAKAYERDGIKIVPCPAESRKVQCKDCRLCTLDRHDGTTIGFALHSISKARKAACKAVS